MADNRLFLGTDDFHSIDISDPTKPKFQAKISDRSRIRRINGMVRRGNHIFAVSKDGWVNAFDVSDLVSPSLVAGIEMREEYDLTHPHDIDLYGDHFVVPESHGFVSHEEGKLATFKVFDGESLLDEDQWTLSGVVSSNELRGANRIQIRGDFAYVACSLRPDRNYDELRATGVVVDISNPEDPLQAATVDWPDIRGSNGLTISGDVWFLAGGQTVQAYDITSPANPQLLVSCQSTEAFPTPDDNAHDLVYRGGFLYVTSQGDNGFVIFSVDDSDTRRLAEGG